MTAKIHHAVAFRDLDDDLEEVDDVVKGFESQVSSVQNLEEMKGNEIAQSLVEIVREKDQEEKNMNSSGDSGIEKSDSECTKSETESNKSLENSETYCSSNPKIVVNSDSQLENTEEMKKESMVIVLANRLPFVLKRDAKNPEFLTRHSSAGGLVTAVAPVVVKSKGTWVGWTGMDDFSETDVIPESNPEDKSPTSGFRSSQAAPVIVNKKQYEDYYNGTCNALLWPLFHSFAHKCVYNPEHWNAYRDVNRIFALKTMEVIRKAHHKRQNHLENYRPEPPLVWIHDYQLLLAAATIRQMCNDEGIPVKMGFFLHIPFPSYDTLMVCPWQQEIIQGLLGNDFIGFHTEEYKRNFIHCCNSNGLWTDNENFELVSFQSRLVLCKELPIGIPYDQFESLSKIAPAVLTHEYKVKELGLLHDVEKKVILGIDRLDYTKGIKERLMAIEILFRKYPEWREKAMFYQVAVPSRQDVQEYKLLRDEVEGMVGRINGQLSTTNWSPIRYIFGMIPQHDLPGYYRDADVALITPLRDGMNLVAKEFVASQDMANPGVLILSPMAGAGKFMQEALSVNPYSYEKVADELDRALKMSLVERTMRMKPMKLREKKYDVDFWVKGFLDGLNQAVEINEEIRSTGGLKHRPHKSFSGVNFEHILGSYLEATHKIGLILDFDGTLSNLAPTPERAFIGAENKKSLERLSNHPDVNIVVISGRKLEDLENKVGLKEVTYAANHGLVIKYKDGKVLSQNVPSEYRLRLSALQKELKERVERNGAWVEEKDLLVAWHYREIERELKDQMLEEAKSIFAKHEFTILHTSKRIENHPPSGFDRGESCLLIIRTIFGMDWEDRVKIVYAGDSDSDEFAIQRLSGIATTFRVTNEDSTAITKTDADLWLNGPEGVLKMTKYIEKVVMGREPSSLSSSRSSIPGAIDRSKCKDNNEICTKPFLNSPPVFRACLRSFLNGFDLLDLRQILTTNNISKLECLLNLLTAQKFHDFVAAHEKFLFDKNLTILFDIETATITTDEETEWDTAKELEEFENFFKATCKRNMLKHGDVDGQEKIGIKETVKKWRNKFMKRIWNERDESSEKTNLQTACACCC